MDIVLIIDQKEASWDTLKDYDGDKVADWMEVVALFKKYGYKWGGDFVSISDKPHKEKSFGYSVAQLLAKYNKKDFMKGTTYVNLLQQYYISNDYKYPILCKNTNQHLQLLRKFTVPNQGRKTYCCWLDVLRWHPCLLLLHPCIDNN